MTALDIFIPPGDYNAQRLHELYGKLVYYLKYPVGPEKEEYVAIYRDFSQITTATKNTLFKNHNVQNYVKQLKKASPPNCFLYIRILNKDEIIEKVGNYKVSFNVFDTKKKKVISETKTPTPTPTNSPKCDLYEIKLPCLDPSDLKLQIDVSWEANVDKVQLKSKGKGQGNTVRQESYLNNLEVDRNVAVLLLKYLVTDKSSKSMSVYKVIEAGTESIKKGILHRGKPKEATNEAEETSSKSIISRLKERLYTPVPKVIVDTEAKAKEHEETSSNWVSLQCVLQLGTQKPYISSKERLTLFKNQVDLYILLANEGMKPYSDIQELKSESKWTNLYASDALYILNQARLHSTLTEYEDDFCRVWALVKIYAKYARTKNLTYLVDALEKLYSGVAVNSVYLTGSWPSEIEGQLDREIYDVVSSMFFSLMPAALLCELVYPYNGYGEHLFKAQIGVLETLTKLAKPNNNYGQYKTKIAKWFLIAARKWLETWEKKYSFQRGITRVIQFLRAVKLFAFEVVKYHKNVLLPRASQKSLRDLHFFLDQIMSTRVVITLRSSLLQLQQKLPLDYTGATEITKRNAIFQAMPYKDAYNSLRIIAEELHTVHDEPPQVRVTLFVIQRWFPLNVTQAWVASEIKKIEGECAYYEKEITTLDVKKLFEDAKNMYENLLGFVTWSHPIFPARTAKDIVYCIDLVAVVYKTWYQKLKPSDRESNYSILSDTLLTFIDYICNVADTLTKNVNTDPDLRSSVVDWILTQEKSWKGVLRACKWRYEKPKDEMPAPKLNILTVGDKKLFRIRMSSKTRKHKKRAKQ